MKKAAINLVEPNAALLAGYAEALRQGWSPNTMRDVSADELASVEADPSGFLADLSGAAGTVELSDGSERPRLPFRLFWIYDGDFCGSIGLRFQRGTPDLPSYIPGHIGYSVVPWKQRRGYATQALGLILPVARSEGLTQVTITCYPDNEPSIKVILANGGYLVAEDPSDPDTGKPRLIYCIEI